MTKSLEALIADAKQSALIMEYIASFESQDIDGDDVELRFEIDDVDTGTDVSLVEQCCKASSALTALIAALEQAQQYANQCDEENQGLMLTIGRLRVEREELESSQLSVKLPPVFLYGHDDLSRDIPVMDARKVKNAIRAAGGIVDGGERV